MDSVRIPAVVVMCSIFQFNTDILKSIMYFLRNFYYFKKKKTIYKMHSSLCHFFIFLLSLTRVPQNLIPITKNKKIKKGVILYIFKILKWWLKIKLVPNESDTWKFRNARKRGYSYIYLVGIDFADLTVQITCFWLWLQKFQLFFS